MDYKHLTEGRRHFWEKPSLAEAILGVIILPILLTGLLFLPVGFLFGIGFAVLYVILLILFVLYFVIAALYKPIFPRQVSEEFVAKPVKRHAIVLKGSPEEKEAKPGISKIVPFRVDLYTYIHGKSNRNVLITGTSGQGKSKLSRHLLGTFDYQKVIFSFKANDEYLRIGYNTIDVSTMLPSPFSNQEAFVNAFLVAFPVASVGIQASLVPTNLDKLAKKAGNWREFEGELKKDLARTKDSNVRSALAFIQANAHRLVYNVGEFSIGKDDIVLDFSSLNDDARNFYAELILRQIYKEMEKQSRKDTLICVDEAHRLTGGEYGKYHTIIVEMSREIRDKGMLWTVTQNYTDIPDHIRNQFATQFIFKTTSQNDQNALRAIDHFLAWTASSLPNHYFIDAQFPNLHSFIPLYYYNPKGEQNIQLERTAEPARLEARTQAQKSTLEFFKPSERISATIHAALLAIYENESAGLDRLARWLKNKGFITSDNTIYGYKERDGVFDSSIKLGLARKNSKTYELTNKGSSWVDPEKILEKELHIGSDLHKRLLIKTIDYLHEKNMLVVAPSEREAPDLIAYPVDSKKKYLWDDGKRVAYEIQTTARDDSIMANAAKRDKYKIPITWVTYDNGILEEIKRLTENKDEYLLIKMS